jgi:predicted MFS family arabinose efflux permease
MTAREPGRPERIATRIAFFLPGMAMAVWAPLVPFAQARLGIDDASLGLVLLCLGAGSIATMPFAAALAARFGCRAAIAVATLVVCAVLPVLAGASHIAVLGSAVFVFGAAIGTIDVTVNIQAVIVERAAGRALMSGFHGLFSVGGIAGAAGTSALLLLGVSPLGATLAMSAILLALLAVAQSDLLRYGGEPGAPPFAVPRGLVLVVGALCFICFLAEGAMLDWSAVFLATQRAWPPGDAGFGYAVFAGGMTLGRLTGDRVVRAVGPRVILTGGAMLAAGALAAAILVPGRGLALAGFGFLGLGASNIVPVLYSALGRQTKIPLGVAVAATTMLGYLGILCGPALIGLAAQATSLPTALLGVAALLTVIAASSIIVS